MIYFLPTRCGRSWDVDWNVNKSAGPRKLNLIKKDLMKVMVLTIFLHQKSDTKSIWRLQEKLYWLISSIEVHIMREILSRKTSSKADSKPRDSDIQIFIFMLVSTWILNDYKSGPTLVGFPLQFLGTGPISRGFLDESKNFKTEFR